MKYELTLKTCVSADGTVLFQIRALRDLFIRSVKAGDLGGFVQSNANLDQEGDCWIFAHAQVYGNAQVVTFLVKISIGLNEAT